MATIQITHFDQLGTICIKKNICIKKTEENQGQQIPWPWQTAPQSTPWSIYLHLWSISRYFRHIHPYEEITRWVETCPYISHIKKKVKKLFQTITDL